MFIFSNVSTTFMTQYIQRINEMLAFFENSSIWFPSRISAQRGNNDTPSCSSNAPFNARKYALVHFFNSIRTTFADFAATSAQSCSIIASTIASEELSPESSFFSVLLPALPCFLRSLYRHLIIADAPIFSFCTRLCASILLFKSFWGGSTLVLFCPVKTENFSLAASPSQYHHLEASSRILTASLPPSLLLHGLPVTIYLFQNSA